MLDKPNRPSRTRCAWSCHLDRSREDACAKSSPLNPFRTALRSAARSAALRRALRRALCRALCRALTRKFLAQVISGRDRPNQVKEPCEIGCLIRKFLAQTISDRDRPNQLIEMCESVPKTMFFNVVFDAPGSCNDREVSGPFLLRGVSVVTHASFLPKS